MAKRATDAKGVFTAELIPLSVKDEPSKKGNFSCTGMYVKITGVPEGFEMDSLKPGWDYKQSNTFWYFTHKVDESKLGEIPESEQKAKDGLTAEERKLLQKLQRKMKS